MTEITDPDVYVETVEAEGFVPATAAALVQVLANTAKIKGLEAAIADLTVRLVKLEKKPKP